MRVINKHKFIVSNGEIIFKSSVKKCKDIRKVNIDESLSNKFLTLDIETRLINYVHTPPLRGPVMYLFL